MVPTKAEGAKINEGKPDFAQRGVPLANWLVDMLMDRRQRVAAKKGGEPEEAGRSDTGCRGQVTRRATRCSDPSVLVLAPA
jgi:hypothetical protein